MLGVALGQISLPVSTVQQAAINHLGLLGSKLWWVQMEMCYHYTIYTEFQKLHIKRDVFYLFLY